jgi:hypothetical protein
VMPDHRRRAILAESRTGRQEASMERADWLEGASTPLRLDSSW